MIQIFDFHHIRLNHSVLALGNYAYSKDLLVIRKIKLFSLAGYGQLHYSPRICVFKEKIKNKSYVNVKLRLDLIL